MVTLTKENAIKAVRKNLDEQEWNPSSMYGESEDNDMLDKIIERTIPEAIDAVHLAAPVSALEGADSSFVEETKDDGVLQFRTEKSVLRFVNVRVAGSDVCVADAVPEYSPEGRKQLNKYVRGTFDNPVLVMQNGTRNRFKYYTVGDQKVVRPRKVADYLYEMNLASIDYDYARDYFAHRDPVAGASGCSCFKSGDFFGSNYDWYYNNDVEFLVRTEAKGGRHAAMGMASLPGMSRELVESGDPSDLYKIMPFYLVDGVNDAGVFAKIQVINKIWDKQETVPAETEEDRICTLMLVRYILDNFATAKEAVEYIRDHVALFSPNTLSSMGYEAHFMVGDKDDSLQYVMELVDGSVEIITEHSQLTNFCMHGVEVGTPAHELCVFVPENVSQGWHPTDTPPNGNNLDEYASGLERWNIMAPEYDYDHSKEEMRELMNRLLYTNAYNGSAQHPWYSEFVGADTYNVDTNPIESIVIGTLRKAVDAYEKRDRNNPKTWHTCHSAIYDLTTGRVYVVSQEDTEHEYSLGFSDTVPEVHIEQLSYIPFCRKADEYQIGSALLTPVIDELTAMVLAIYGEDGKAKYFFNKAGFGQPVSE